MRDVPLPASGSVFDNRTALLVLLLAPSFFAINNVAAKLAAGTISPGVLSLSRWGVTATVLGLVFGRSLLRKSHVLRKEALHLIGLGALGMAGASLATYEAALTTSAVNIGFIFAAAPAVILFLDRGLSGEPLTLSQIVAAIFCTAGIVLVVGKSDLILHASLTYAPGDLVAIAGMFAWAGYSVMLRHWPTQLSGPERAASTAAVGTLISLPVVFFQSGHYPPLAFTQHTVTVLVAIAFGAGLGVILAHAYLTRVLGPRRTVVLLYLVPVYNVALAWLLAGEVMDRVQIVGASLLLAGVYIAMRAGQAPARPAAQAQARQSSKRNETSVKLEEN